MVTGEGDADRANDMGDVSVFTREGVRAGVPGLEVEVDDVCVRGIADEVGALAACAALVFLRAVTELHR